jgi:phosphatidylserine decarboxylase
MTVRSLIAQVALQEDFNFLVTNRIPRRLVTQFMGWFSKIEQPLIRDLSIAVWRLFADPNLAEAAKPRFSSLHDCFVRELKSGARTIDRDPSVMVSPCDGIVGGSGRVDGDVLIQAKGLDYTLADLLIDPTLVSRYRDGHYVTLRLSSSMYHRFHAPHDLTVERVTYVSGDTWNTNPITVKRVERLFCKNERAILQTRLADGHVITLVPVASILVASIRLHCLDVVLHLKYPGPNVIACQEPYRKGDEMGWFELGSTIIVFAPPALRLADGVTEGAVVQMGQPLFRLP